MIKILNLEKIKRAITSKWQGNYDVDMKVWKESFHYKILIETDKQYFYLKDIK